MLSRIDNYCIPANESQIIDNFAFNMLIVYYEIKKSQRTHSYNPLIFTFKYSMLDEMMLLIHFSYVELACSLIMCFKLWLTWI